jgi:hypothetical protein
VPMMPPIMGRRFGLDFELLAGVRVEVEVG